MGGKLGKQHTYVVSGQVRAQRAFVEYSIISGFEFQEGRFEQGLVSI